jgi:hypothetical protein
MQFKPYPKKKLHINFKMSKFDRRFSLKKQNGTTFTSVGEELETIKN